MGFPQLGKEKHMKGKLESTRNRGFRRTLIAGAFGAVALGVAAAPALADTVIYGSPGYYYAPPPATVYTPAPTYTYTYEAPVYSYPAPVYRYERGPGVYVDTPILGVGIGFH
jgi:hypothetical protein